MTPRIRDSVVQLATGCYWAVCYFRRKALADQYRSETQVYEDLRGVAAAIEQRQFKQAERLLEEIKVKMDWENTWGFDYPNSIRNDIKALSSEIEDGLGRINRYPAVVGKIVAVTWGPSWGTFVVEDKKDRYAFDIDAATIVDWDCNLKKGTRVKVYLDPGGFGDAKAAKIVCLKRRK